MQRNTARYQVNGDFRYLLQQSCTAIVLGGPSCDANPGSSAQLYPAIVCCPNMFRSTESMTVCDRPDSAVRRAEP
jgi:hypothetical protein